jgi:hypothetical protein
MTIRPSVRLRTFAEVVVVLSLTIRFPPIVIVSPIAFCVTIESLRVSDKQ